MSEWVGGTACRRRRWWTPGSLYAGHACTRQCWQVREFAGRECCDLRQPLPRPAQFECIGGIAGSLQMLEARAANGKAQLLVEGWHMQLMNAVCVEEAVHVPFMMAS